MLLENKREKTIDNHKNIFNLYKELKQILPIGYIKTRVSRGQKYAIQKQSILTRLEKEKNKEIITPSKITKNLFYNRNIYIFAGENEKKDFLSKIQKFNNPSKVISINNNENDTMNISDNSINNNKNKINILKNYLTNTNNLNTLSEKEFFSDRTNNKVKYRSSTINNCFMKNNIFLPSITHRIKNNLPRYNRQSDGFLLKGMGRTYFKNLKYKEKQVNEYTNIDADILNNNNKSNSINNNMYETIRLNKNEKDDNNEDMNYASCDKYKKIKINNPNDIKNKFNNFLSQYSLKVKEPKITGIKKKSKSHK